MLRRIFWFIRLEDCETGVAVHRIELEVARLDRLTEARKCVSAERRIGTIISPPRIWGLHESLHAPSKLGVWTRHLAPKCLKEQAAEAGVSSRKDFSSFDA